MSEYKNTDFHIVMFPWFAFGHMSPYIHLANELAQRGCKITVLLPKRARERLVHLNSHPDSITLHPLIIPTVDGLPAGAETATDIPIEKTRLLCTAHDRIRDQFEKVIRKVKPALVIYDNAYWIPEVTRPLGIKNVSYNVISAAAIATSFVVEGKAGKEKELTDEELTTPPVGYPSSKVVFRRHEGRSLLFLLTPVGENMSFIDRVTMTTKEADVMALRACSEIDGNLCDFVGRQYNRRVLLTGPVLPETPNTPLEERWFKWLSKFEPGSVVYCAFGSQPILDQKQFQELCLGFESTGLPFLVALPPPIGSSTIEEALPEGFEERVKGRGLVWGGWVQQVQILSHPSVGCFVSHCGFGSMWESLLSDCQIVLVPHLSDQILNTRLLADELNVAVEVEREENGWFSKENLTKVIKTVMDKDSEVGNTLRKNHTKWKSTLTRPGFMSGYMDRFVEDLKELAK